MARIVIDYDEVTKQMNVSYPSADVLALGMMDIARKIIERASDKARFENLVEQPRILPVVKQ